MNAPTQAVATREATPAVQFRDQLSKMDRELATALPPHIPVERFMRVVLTAVNGNPQLLGADRRSLFESAMKAAQDGLLPDGRDGALVIFRAKVKDGNRDVWIDKVQWMPMVGGILKKVRNSGDLLTIAAHVAYEKDTFKYSLGDEEKIEHIPSLLDDRGKPAIVYAVAKTKDGGIYREVMSIRDIEKVRNVSRAKDRGPWVDWWDEMAKKTVIRRLAKRLPMSSDLDDLIRRDDDLYDFTGKRTDAGEQHGRLFKVVENPLADDAPAQIEEYPEGASGTAREAPSAGSGDVDLQSASGTQSAPPSNSSQPTTPLDRVETDAPASEQSPLPQDAGDNSEPADNPPQVSDDERAQPGPAASSTGLPQGWEITYAAALRRAQKIEGLDKHAAQYWSQYGGWEKHKNGPDTETAKAIFDAFQSNFGRKEVIEAALRELF